MKQLFQLGRLGMSRAARETLHPDDVSTCLQRHTLGDWGEVLRDDVEENELALKMGYRLFSVYTDRNGVPFWVITEADRSLTTILLPSEY